eukprot:TRINITY_DN100678_c0_g1_i1.p1 TRINITY_DN100678_c0_g1~~TRINITY_DN100678_c0_g1_i1.p1  ORF type:complete len:686 (-),score=119.13 TRINITY_DN100678_c0_g1_i1:214-2271(-)
MASEEGRAGSTGSRPKQTAQSLRESVQSRWAKVASCVAACSPLGTREVLRKDVREQLRKRRFESVTPYMRLCLPVGTCLTVFFIFSAGANAVDEIFWRLNNGVSLGLLCVWWLLHRVHRTFLEKIHDSLVLVFVLHYISMQSVTSERIERLLDVELSHGENIVLYNNEPYCILWSLLAMLATASIHLMSDRNLLVMAIFGPCVWLLQALTLGSAYAVVDLLKLFLMYCTLSLFLWVAARRREAEYEKEMVRQSELLDIINNASVPIAVVGTTDAYGKGNKKIRSRPLRRFLRSSAGDADSESSSSECTQQQPKQPQPGVEPDWSELLQLELWNTAMEEATLTKVTAGTILEEVPCLKTSEQMSLLANALWLALQKKVRTERMLLPFASTAGTVWLQLDICHVSLDGPKAIVIGSDVTQFVEEHYSLLQPVMAQGQGDTALNLDATMESIQQGCREVASQKSSIRHRSVSESGCSTSIVSAPREYDVTEAVIACNVASFEIIEATASITSICGPAFLGADIMSWLKSTDRERCIAAITEKVNDMIAEQSEDFETRDPGQVSIGQVTLRPPIAARAHLQYHAACTIEILTKSEYAAAGGKAAGDEDEDESQQDAVDGFVVRLRLTGIKQSRYGRSRGKARSRASQSDHDQVRGDLASSVGAPEDEDAQSVVVSVVESAESSTPRISL